ncbi:MAG: asparaginase [Nitrospinota bacterium]
MAKPRVCIVATGGTIASKYDAELGGWVAAASAEDLVAAAPGLAEVAELRLVEHSRVNSSRMDTATAFGLRDRLREALADESAAGAVVTHGTATLEETAYLLDLTLGSEKPVVLTGAQRRFDEKDADGPRNLLFAVRVAADPAARERGVLVALGGEVHSARDAIKAHTDRLAAFSSRDGGPVGMVTKDSVTFFSKPDRRPHFEVDRVKENVQLIKMAQGANDLLVRACTRERADGIVVEGVGGGNVNDAHYHALCDALRAGIPVVVVTRILGGCPHAAYAFPGSLRSLLERGAISGGYLSGPKARILLMVALARTQDREELREIFARA